jgi:hypothetical protein
MHITYEFRKFMTDFGLNASNKAKSPLEMIEQRINDLRTEEKEIIKVCTQLTQFLRVNALNPINDDILDYIQHFIREERTKRNSGVQNDGVIAGLEQLLADYKHEMTILQRGMGSDQRTASTNTVEPEEIFLLVGTLYHLPINGAKIRAQVDELKRNQNKFSQNREHIVNLPAEAASSSVMSELESILT